MLQDLAAEATYFGGERFGSERFGLAHVIALLPNRQLLWVEFSGILHVGPTKSLTFSPRFSLKVAMESMNGWFGIGLENLEIWIFNMILLPFWKLTLIRNPRYVWSKMVFLFHGGICDRSLEGNHQPYAFSSVGTRQEAWWCGRPSQNLHFATLFSRFVATQIFLEFSPRTLGKWSNLTSIFFRWVETTNQFLNDVRHIRVHGLGKL